MRTSSLLSLAAAALVVTPVFLPSAAAAQTGSAPRANVEASVHSSARLARRISLRIGSYNIRKPDKAMPWTKSRRKLVASQILHNSFDVIGLQEANGNDNFATLYPKVKKKFKSNARCAKVRHTNIRDARARILFNPKRFSGSRAMSGRLNLDHSSRPDADFACYQLLTDKRTGAKFLVISTHDASGTGRAKDNRRYRQIKNLVSDVAKIQKSHHASWPVLWPGDYNSSASHKYSFDGPTRAMRAHSARDADKIAKKHKNAKYNSANQLQRTPIRTHHHVDHIFVSRSVTVSKFKVIVRLHAKRYKTPFASDHNPIRATVKIPY